MLTELPEKLMNQALAIKRVIFTVPFRSASIPASSEDLTPQKIDDQDNKPKKKENFLTKLLPNSKEVFQSGRSQVPTSLSFENPRGFNDYDPDYPLEQIMKETPGLIKEHAKKFWKENRYPFGLEKPDFYKRTRGSLHGETIVHYTFKSEEDFKLWHFGSDSDWSEGYSKCELFRTDRNTAIFQGTLSTKVVKDGKTKRAGWCGIKTFDRLAFNRKKYFDWRHFTHLLIKCRGDGRSYKVMLHSPEYADVTWGDSHSYPLHTHGGPYWQYEKIPFSRFFHTVNGRIQDRQYSIRDCRISSMGIVLMDRIDGDFRLEIDFIGVTNDTSHKEKFAYETYQLPVLNTTGF